MLNTRERIALAGDVAQWGAHYAASSFEEGRLDYLAIVIWQCMVNDLEQATYLANNWDWGFLNEKEV